MRNVRVYANTFVNDDSSNTLTVGNCIGDFRARMNVLTFSRYGLHTYCLTEGVVLRDPRRSRRNTLTLEAPRTLRVAAKNRPEFLGNGPDLGAFEVR